MILTDAEPTQIAKAGPSPQVVQGCTVYEPKDGIARPFKGLQRRNDRLREHPEGDPISGHPRCTSRALPSGVVLHWISAVSPALARLAASRFSTRCIRK
jgi:hypothetical protein